MYHASLFMAVEGAALQAEKTRQSGRDGEADKLIASADARIALYNAAHPEKRIESVVPQFVKTRSPEALATIAQKYEARAERQRCRAAEKKWDANREARLVMVGRLAP
jgi:hypothetical protein